MKKAAFIVGFFLLASPVLAADQFLTNLKLGASGQNIVVLQDLLTDEGCFTSNSTGYFGLITFRAVKCFQSKYGLPITGYFGPLSRAQANSLFASATDATTQAEIVETGTTTPIMPTDTISPPSAPVSVPSTNQNFGGIITNTMPTAPICSLSVPTNTGDASSFVEITWTTTDATSVKIHNNHVSDGLDAYGYPLALNGTRKVQLSSEAGENNILTLSVSGPGGDTSCTKSVLTK